MPVKIEQISDDKCILGESPFWDEKTQSLYYVDILGKTVIKYNPSTKKYVRAVGDKNISFIIPIEGDQNKFLIGYGNQIAKITWDGNSNKIGNLETIVEVKNTGGPVNCWNDGKADPTGRLWAGVFVQKGSDFDVIPNAGSLYTLKSDKTLKELDSGISLTNGLAWNEKVNKFYYADTVAGEVYEYDYNKSSYEISNKKAIFRVTDPEVEGRPDGLTIDSEGNIWIAMFGGGKIVKVNPNVPNKVAQTIDMPVKQVTCVEFAGPNYEDLYVTTASFQHDETPAPAGGWTYKITGLGVKGVPARKIKL